MRGIASPVPVKMEAYLCRGSNIQLSVSTRRAGNELGHVVAGFLVDLSFASPGTLRVAKSRRSIDRRWTGVVGGSGQIPEKRSR